MSGVQLIAVSHVVEVGTENGVNIGITNRNHSER